MGLSQSCLSTFLCDNNYKNKWSKSNWFHLFRWAIFSSPKKITVCGSSWKIILTASFPNKCNAKKKKHPLLPRSSSVHNVSTSWDTFYSQSYLMLSTKQGKQRMKVTNLERREKTQDRLQLKTPYTQRYNQSSKTNVNEADNLGGGGELIYRNRKPVAHNDKWKKSQRTKRTYTLSLIPKSCKKVQYDLRR